jgi:Uncharacterised protein family (UPF0175)
MAYDIREVSIMAEKDFQVSLPAEVVGAFGWNDSEVPQRVREALVMDLLRLDRLSEAQAAAILGLARWELLELMGRYDVPAVRVSVEELDRELATDVKRNGAS